MKLVDDTEVIQGSTGKQKKFTIEASPKAFIVLSDKLYKNKPRAVVREISTNCLDAHILNGNQARPFDIKAPSRLDPRLIMRDYGPGLDADRIENLLTTYFASTKSNSNDFIGAFGLGFKAPFSYTETFNITSYHEGKVYGYMALRNGGEPELRPLFVDDMKEDDETGLEITVPIADNDINSFNYEIGYIVRTFDVKPNIKGAQITTEIFPEGEWFSMRSSYEGSGLYAIYGKIVYPIEKFSGLNCEWLLEKDRSVYVHFPMGELDITPSREELSLDATTIENIKARINKLEESVLTGDIERYQSIENKRELTRELNNMTANQRSILRKRSVDFQGKTNAEWDDMFSIKHLNDELEKLQLGVYQVVVDSKRQRLTNHWGSRSRVNTNRLLSVDQKELLIMIDDKPSRRLSTIRGLYYKEQHRYKTFIFLSDEIPAQAAMMQKLIKLFEGDTVTVLRCSELEEYRKEDERINPSEKSDRPKSPNGQKTWYDHEYKHWKSMDLHLSKDEIEELEGYAISRSRDDMNAFPGDEYLALSISTVQHQALTAGIDSFYVIRPAALKRARLNDNLVSLYRAILDKAIALLDEVNFDEYIPNRIANKRPIVHLTNNPKISWILSELLGNKNSEAAANLARFGNLNGVSVSSDTKFGKEIALYVKTYNILNNAANSDAQKILDNFAAKYPVVNYMLNEYQVENYVDDIDKIMKLLLKEGN